ncbi:ThuA domain-containing protein [Desertivirga brevis]|uniref:ThuA domain-containing protein n=1 Tax=Desertivirga brevis TaxID=2810310 RepID=UPI001A9695F5|nr:ThuA domain-containing protein [Pedobacter sp. SYSU D00873]
MAAVLITSFKASLASYPQKGKKKVVLIAGEKSHPAGTHEYIKTVRLIKTMLDNSNVSGEVKTEVHLHGWPSNENTLNDADLILFVSDGNDGYNFGDVPFMTPSRMEVMEKQMKRGCSLSLIHFSTFATYNHGQSILKWAGGYFDWQDSKGNRHNYSSLKEMEAELKPANTVHPILNGIKPFQLKEEFYYNMRFLESKEGLTPLLEAPALKGNPGTGNIVSWALQRPDGGRAFSSTMNHYYSNWGNKDYRKFMLNGIAWAAGIDIPENGVEARYYRDAEVTSHIYKRYVKALLITTGHSQAWAANTIPLQDAIDGDKRIMVDVTSNINDIWQYDLNDYKLLILNRKDTVGINRYSEEVLEGYLKNGGSMLALTFKYHDAGRKSTIATAGWAEYASIFRRELVGDNDNTQPTSMRVTAVNPQYPTKGIKVEVPVTFRLEGEREIDTLLLARDRASGISMPLVWTYTYGRGRIFQSSIGSNPADFKQKNVSRLFRKMASEIIVKE